MSCGFGSGAGRVGCSIDVGGGAAVTVVSVVAGGSASSAGSVAGVAVGSGAVVGESPAMVVSVEVELVDVADEVVSVVAPTVVGVESGDAEVVSLSADPGVEKSGAATVVVVVASVVEPESSAGVDVGATSVPIGRSGVAAVVVSGGDVSDVEVTLVEVVATVVVEGRGTIGSSEGVPVSGFHRLVPRRLPGR